MDHERLLLALWGPLESAPMVVQECLLFPVPLDHERRPERVRLLDSALRDPGLPFLLRPK